MTELEKTSYTLQERETEVICKNWQNFIIII